MKPKIELHVGENSLDAKLLLTTSDGLEINLFKHISCTDAEVTFKIGVDEVLPKLNLTLLPNQVIAKNLDVDPEILEAAAKAIRERRAEEQD